MDAVNDQRQVPLTNHPLFDIEDVDKARQVLSGLYGNVSLEPERPVAAFNGFSNGIELPRITINYTRLDEAYMASKAEPIDFYSIQLMGSGIHVFDIDREQKIGTRRQGLMLSAGQKIRIQGSKNNSILALIIKETDMRSSITTFTGHDRFPSIRFARSLELTTQKNSSLLSIISTFINELNRSGGILEAPAAVAGFENLLITTFLFGLDHNLTHVLRQPAKEAGTDLVRKVEEYLESHASLAIDMERLASETAHSISSIYRTFKRYRGYTPMEFLQNVRFSTVRKHLLNPCQGDTVTQIALKHGFFHLGRFSVVYKQRFGESPGVTLKKSMLKDRL